MGALREFVADMLESEGAAIEPVDPDGLEVLAPAPRKVKKLKRSRTRPLNPRPVWRFWKPSGTSLERSASAARKSCTSGMPSRLASASPRPSRMVRRRSGSCSTVCPWNPITPMSRAAIPFAARNVSTASADRSLCGSNDWLSATVRISCSEPRTAALVVVWGYPQSNGRVVGTPNHRSLSLGQRTEISHSRQ
jgi:hypothetical protein